MGEDPLLAELTDPQREAVTACEGPLLVLAGAGSGKTRVITRRAAYIARTVARPEEVLAITFTNKAAGEMRERIAALGIGGSMWVYTFHALCARLLRLHGGIAGLAPNFSIFDESDRRSLVCQSLDECQLRAENWHPRVMEEAISDAKNRLRGPDEFDAEAHDFSTKTIARVYRKYQSLLLAQNGCDFDDLLMHVALILRDNDGVRRELSGRFRFLLIDEYQDTNHAQYIIASQLASTHRNICATGDPDQSIYAWRGADLRNILDFEADYPDARIVRLEQNFRSCGTILSAASSLIARNVRRKPKSLWTAGRLGEPVRVWSCDDERLEAAAVAQELREFLDGGGRGGDVAIFYRVNSISRVVEDALRERHVPYQIVRGVEFYQRKEIKDVLAYLRVMANQADETALFRAMKSPARGLGKATQERLTALARQRGVTASEALPLLADAKGATAGKLRAFSALWAELRGLGDRPVKTIVETVVKRSGLEDALRGAHEADDEPLANVYELINAAKQFDTDNPEGTLGDWLQQISLMSDADALQADGGPVTLMTLHTAKGLEYPIVYIVGLEEGLLPHHRALRGDETELEEERRLCFVGITRAMRSLTLSHALYRMVRGVNERALASRFLRELPSDEIDRRTIQVERDRSRAHLGRYNQDERPVEAAGYAPGQRVRHEEYGEGEVVAVEPRGRSIYLRILFQDVGERTFAVEHVTLSVMDC